MPRRKDKRLRPNQATAFFFCDYWPESLLALLLPPRESSSLPLAAASLSEPLWPEPALRPAACNACTVVILVMVMVAVVVLVMVAVVVVAVPRRPPAA